MTDQTPAVAAVRVVRGAPDEWEVAALVAGLAAAAAPELPEDAAPVDEWTSRIRGLRGTGGATAASSGHFGHPGADTWRWSLRS